MNSLVNVKRAFVHTVAITAPVQSHETLIGLLHITSSVGEFFVPISPLGYAFRG